MRRRALEELANVVSGAIGDEEPLDGTGGASVAYLSLEKSWWP